MKISFCLHCHQPVGNFNDVIEEAFRNCYLPLLDTMRNHPGVPVGLHISGCLLDWLTENHPGYIDAVRSLCLTCSLELLTSGYYEPLLPIFRHGDIQRQIMAYSDRLEALSGRKPEGLWLTERVWEPGMASLIAEAGPEYAVVDDTHLMHAGVSPENLYRPWITEDSGLTLKLLGSSKRLRYMIPFSPIGEVMDTLRGWHESGRKLAFYGDDGEKFGVWPGTNELCYVQVWLSKFLDAIESSPWLDAVLPSAAVKEVPASGPVYIPASSYIEMGEWTLPAADQDSLRNLRSSLEQAGLTEASEPFLRGGIWRGFLSKYPESNELHKRVLFAQNAVYSSKSSDSLDHFWKSQCNCSYWHGVFGGLYLPHLREAVWKELHLAEREAHRILDDLPLVVEEDLDADGKPEILVIGGEKSMLIRPGAGLTVSEFSFIPHEGDPVPMGHVLTRRHESYHTDAVTSDTGGGVRTIHDASPCMEAGLAESIVCDTWRRISFTDLILPAGTGRDDWLESGEKVIHFQDSDAEWSSDQSQECLDISARLEHGAFTVSKRLIVSLDDPVLRAVSGYSSETESFFRAGMEICLNMLTGSEPDRYIILDDGPPDRLGSTGCSSEPARRITIADTWRGVSVEIIPDSPVDVWYTPLNSISRSESGFEKVHQGIAVYMSVSGEHSGGCSVGFRLRLGRA